ncbi:MAG: hypothetical protein AAB614_00090 [Patescibacteria group bacterium]
MRYIFLLIFAFILSSFGIKDVFAAEGDLLWSKSIDQTSSQDSATAIAVDASGIYVAGRIQNVTGYDAKIDKLSLDGTTVIASRILNIANPYRAEITDIALDATGIYISGYKYACCLAWDLEWFVKKISLDLTTEIWSDNQNYTVGGSTEDTANSIAVDATGLYVGGSILHGGAGSKWRLEKRSLTTGIVSDFAIIDVGPTGMYNNLKSIDIDATSIYLAGSFSDSSSNKNWRIEKRAISNLNTIIWARNVGTGANNIPYSIAVDATGVYVGGTFTTWNIKKLSIVDGTVIWSRSDSTVVNGYPASIDLGAPGNIYSIGYDIKVGSDSWWHFDKRDTNGNLLWSQEENPSLNFDIPFGVVIDSASNGIYVVGYDAILGNANIEWRIEKRTLSLICTGQKVFVWTDPALTAGLTKIRKVHIDELRSNINIMRLDAGLITFLWTDPIIASGATKIRATHIQELRTAILDVYTACGSIAPVFSDATLVAGTTKIRKVHIDELRSAVNLVP